MVTYRFGPFRLDKDQLLLSAGSEPLPLGPKVVETLLALVERSGELVTKNEILDRVWPEGYVEEANLAQNIYVIRKTLRAHWPQNAIETVPRRGYRFVAPLCGDDRPAAQPSAELPARVRPRTPFGALAAAAAVFVLLAGFATYDVARPYPHPAPALSAGGARLYAMGQYYWNQRTGPAIAKSERYFGQVIASDPRDARGYAGLASAYAIAADYGYGPGTKKSELSSAAALAHKALRLDARSAQAYAVLGLVDVDRMQMGSALAQYRRALALDPSDAPAHQWYGAALLTNGKALEGYKELQRAANLDPSSVAATDWLAQAAFISRRYGDALAYGRQALDLSPQRYEVYQIIGMAYEALGNERAAIGAYQTYARDCAQCRYDAAALEAHAYALSHDMPRANAELALAYRGMAMHAVAYDNMMSALIALGRKREALEFIHRGKFDEPAALLAIDPRMDALRQDASFRRYTQRPG